MYFQNLLGFDFKLSFLIYIVDTKEYETHLSKFLLITAFYGGVGNNDDDDNDDDYLHDDHDHGGDNDHEDRGANEEAPGVARVLAPFVPEAGPCTRKS